MCLFVLFIFLKLCLVFACVPLLVYVLCVCLCVLSCLFVYSCFFFRVCLFVRLLFVVVVFGGFSTSNLCFAGRSSLIVCV